MCAVYYTAHFDDLVGDRALVHALVLGVYISFWSMLYVQLVDLGKRSRPGKVIRCL